MHEDPRDQILAFGTAISEGAADIPGLDHWRSLPIAQAPSWADEADHRAAVAELSALPPLVFAGEVDLLRARLADVAQGRAFLLQGGDCAETFAGSTANRISARVKTILQMAAVLTYGASMPVVKMGRIAGQFAKPRSSDTETRDGVTLPSFRGEIVNGYEFTEQARRHDARRMVQAYHTSASTLNLVRAFTQGGFADLRSVHQWNQGFMANPAYAQYEEMAAEAEKSRKLDFEEIQIPTPPRLGNVVVEVSHLDKGFEGRTLIKDLSFTLPRNGIVGVIGPNGVGKTTLFKTIVGLEQPDSGEVKVGETVKLSYVDQSRSGIDPKKNVWQVVSDGLDFIEVGQNEIPSRAYVSAFGFKGPDQQKPAGVLSGGERNRLNLALTLKEGGNLILLDEPTNDLDVETLSSLENALEAFPGCAVVISHDRWFLDRTCTHILAWEGDVDNEAKWFWFEGNFGAYEENKVERLGIDAARPHRVTHRRLTRD